MQFKPMRHIMTVRLTEAFQELEADGRTMAINEIGQLLGAFPAEHRVREYAAQCPKVREAMAGVQPLSEAEAMKAVLKAAFANTPDDEKYAGYGDRGKPRISIQEVADRIRMAVRPSKPDAMAARGAVIAARLARTNPRFRRTTLATRGRGSY
jgi:hypothetical protein